MIDIENARELVERARRRASSGVQPIFNGEVADTIDALIAEVERLKTVPMKYRRMAFNAQLQEENALLLAERAALARDAARWRALLELDSPTVCEWEENGDWVPVHPQNIEKVVDAAMKGASDDQG